MAKQKLPGLQAKQPNIEYGQRAEKEVFVSGANPVTYKYTTGKSGSSESRPVTNTKTKQTHQGHHHTPES